MARSHGFGKTIVLLFLVIILALLGILWFDFLGVINAKHFFAPFYKLIGLEPQRSVSVSSPDSLERADLDNDRFAKRLEALDLREEELDKREDDIDSEEQKNAQIAQELEDRRISLDEREKTFNNSVKVYDTRDKNIAQIVSDLNGMRPANAVVILEKMDDQDVIDVLRKAKDVAKAEGKTSMVAYWLSLMPPERAAVINSKMANKPDSLD